MEFDYIDDFGNNLLYTQPYNKNGDRLVVFAFPAEEEELRNKLDYFIGTLKDSGEFREMYEDHFHSPLDEEN